MADGIEVLRVRMEAAAAELDFEEAKRLRDKINLLRGGATVSQAEDADTSGLVRQKPGAMGIGTSQSRPVTPPDWRPPVKPDPMTQGRNRRKRR
jgi:hypothetical protein